MHGGAAQDAIEISPCRRADLKLAPVSAGHGFTLGLVSCVGIDTLAERCDRNGPGP